MSIKVEEKEFVFSEDQLVVEIDSRNREYQDSSEQSHPYISTCMVIEIFSFVIIYP